MFSRSSNRVLKSSYKCLMCFKKTSKSLSKSLFPTFLQSCHSVTSNFTKAKTVFENKMISDHEGDYGKYFKAACGDPERGIYRLFRKM